MSQTQRRHTAGNRRRFMVDYTDYLRAGATLDTFAAVLSGDVTATVTDVSILPNTSIGVFFVNDGEEGEEFTVELTATTSYDETKIDEVPFLVVAP